MKNHSLSLMFVISIALSGITPALNAMQTVKRGVARAMPAWTKGPGFTAAKKWWKKEPLSSEEQAAFNRLKNRVGIAAIISLLVAIVGTIAYKSPIKEIVSEAKKEIQKIKLAPNVKKIIDLAEKYDQNALMKLEDPQEIKKKETEQTSIQQEAIEVMENIMTSEELQEFRQYLQKNRLIEDKVTRMLTGELST